MTYIGPQDIIISNRNIQFTIEFFLQSDYNKFKCRTMCRFLPEHIFELKELLRIPDKCYIGGGHVAKGYDVLLYGLFRLHQVGNLEDDSLMGWGGDNTILSRKFKFFNKYLFRLSQYLFRNVGIPYFRGQMEMFSDAIKAKLQLSYDYIHPPDADFIVAMFIDVQELPCSVPAGGSQTNGAGAARWNNNLQAMFYSGYKHNHGVKFQNICGPNGMILSVNVGRMGDFDSTIYRDLNMAEILQPQLFENGVQYKLFGDNIYAHSPLVITNARGQGEAGFHLGRSIEACRGGIEHCHKLRSSNWAFDGLKTKNQVFKMNGSSCIQIYYNTFLLMNFHTLFYGNQIAEFFNWDHGNLTPRIYANLPVGNTPDPFAHLYLNANDGN